MHSAEGLSTGLRPGVSRWMIGAAATVCLLGLVAVLALTLGWAGARRSQQKLEVEAMNANYMALRQSVARDFQSLEQRLTQAEQENVKLAGHLKLVTQKLRLTEAELQRAAADAAQARQADAQRVAALDSLQRELAGKAGADSLKALGGEVAGVRDDLGRSKVDLQQAQNDLSAFVARNHEEIQELRRLGQRQYFEFTLPRNKRQPVGNIQVELRSTNPRKNLYTVVLYTDEMRVEKRNRTLNEPILFYTRGSRLPLELVINRVDRNSASGYLSAPKIYLTPSPAN